MFGKYRTCEDELKKDEDWGAQIDRKGFINDILNIESQVNMILAQRATKWLIQVPRAGRLFKC